MTYFEQMTLKEKGISRPHSKKPEQVSERTIKYFQHPSKKTAQETKQTPGIILHTKALKDFTGPLFSVLG